MQRLCWGPHRADWADWTIQMDSVHPNVLPIHPKQMFFLLMYDDEKYDSSSSEQDYFPTDDNSLLWHTDESAEDSEDFGMIVDFSE